MKYSEAFKAANAALAKDLMKEDLTTVERVLNEFPEVVREGILTEIYKLSAVRNAARSRVPNESVRYIAPKRSVKMRSEHRRVKVLIADGWDDTDVGGAMSGFWTVRETVFALHGTRRYNPTCTYRLRIYDPAPAVVTVKII